MLCHHASWDRNYNTYCIDREPATLFCALALCAKKRTGFYDDNAGYVQILVKNIITHYPQCTALEIETGSYSTDLLLSFNNHPQTRFEDVIRLLENASSQIKNKSCPVLIYHAREN